MDSLMQILSEISSTSREIPDLNQWQPPHCGTMDLCIKANGEWWHEGQKIQRPALIALFSKVLCYENGQ